MAVRWVAALSPLWGDMAVTTNLTDGNTGTFETSSASASVGPSANCVTRVLSAPLTAEERHTTEQSLASWRARGSLTLTLAQLQSLCALDPELDPPPTGGTALVSLQYWDGSAWQVLDTYTPAVPTLVYQSSATLSFDTGVRSVSHPACRFRVAITYGYTWTGSNNTITIITTLSEFALSLSDLGTACPDDDGGGGGGGGGGDGGCTTEWTPGEDCSASWAVGAAPSPMIWVKKGCE